MQRAFKGWFVSPGFVLEVSRTKCWQFPHLKVLGCMGVVAEACTGASAFTRDGVDVHAPRGHTFELWKRYIITVVLSVCVL